MLKATVNYVVPDLGTISVDVEVPVKDAEAAIRAAQADLMESAHPNNVVSIALAKNLVTVDWVR